MQGWVIGESLHGASGAPLLRTSDRDGDLPSLSRAQRMVENLAAGRKALLGSGMEKTQTMLSHQPSVLVCSSIHPKAFPHDSCYTESQAVPPAEGSTFEHAQLGSPHAKPYFCHPEISLFNLPTSSLFGHGTSFGQTDR